MSKLTRTPIATASPQAALMYCRSARTSASAESSLDAATTLDLVADVEAILAEVDVDQVTLVHRPCILISGSPASPYNIYRAG